MCSASTLIQNVYFLTDAESPVQNRCLHQFELECSSFLMQNDIQNVVDKYQIRTKNIGSLSKQIPIRSYSRPKEPWKSVETGLLKFPTTMKGHQYMLETIHHLQVFHFAFFIDKVFCIFNSTKVLLLEMA